MVLKKKNVKKLKRTVKNYTFLTKLRRWKLTGFAEYQKNRRNDRTLRNDGILTQIVETRAGDTKEDQQIELHISIVNIKYRTYSKLETRASNRISSAEKTNRMVRRLMTRNIRKSSRSLS